MFGAGWTEMLIIGVVALVVIGPKDLPIVMRKLGRVVATVRRMGSEFQQEINKTTGLDQLTDLRRSITEPLRQTHDEIVSEFNKVTAMGVEPSGVIKPADPKVESVYDQIAANAAPTTGPGAAAAAMSAPPPVMKPMAPMSEPLPAPAEATVPVAATRPKRATKAKAANGAAKAATPAEAKPVAAKPAQKPAAKRATKAPAKSSSDTATAAAAAKPKTTRARPTTAAAKAAGPEAIAAPAKTPTKPTRTRAKKA